MNDKSKLKWVSIQSKVSGKTAARLDAIAERGGFKSRYELMQYIVSAFLKVADSENEESAVDKENRAYIECERMFGNWMNSMERIITTKPMCGEKMKLLTSIYIYGKIGKKGSVVKVVKPGEDRVFVNSSVDNALEELLKKLHPHTYSELKKIGTAWGETNARCTIDAMVEEIGTEGLQSGNRTIQKEFANNANNIQYGNKPKQKRNMKTMETI